MVRLRFILEEIDVGFDGVVVFVASHHVGDEIC